jgi:putative ABC transport system ATP-binding protein
VKAQHAAINVTQLSPKLSPLSHIGQIQSNYQNKKGFCFMEILKVENLSKIYGSGAAEVKAVDDVSFSVRRGEFVAIIGASGSGKSTLLHMIGGVDRPTAGKVFLEDTDIYQLNENNLAIFRRRQVGLIYQFYNLLPILNVEENITLPLLLDERKIDQSFLNELLDTLDLADRIGHLPNELSGGEQQRVSIGRSLINRPAIVLADEPTGNLDSKNSQEIIDLLKLSNKRYQQTLIMITHDQGIALQADRMLTLADGRIVKDEVIRP